MSQTGDGRLLRVAVTVALVLFGVPLLTGAVMMPAMGGGMGVPETMLVTALVVPIAVLLLIAVLGGQVLASSDGGDDALDELRMAYARGEVDDEELERRRQRLRED